MIWQAGITVVLLGYIVAYWRQGITHPIPLMLIYWLIMLPFKYFLFRLLAVPFNGGASLAMVDQGSLYLFAFLVFVVLFHWFFSHVRTPFPMIEAIPRVGFAWPTVGLMAMVVALAVAENGVSALRDSLKIRTVAETGFGAYLQFAIMFSMTVALVSLASETRKWPLVLLFVAVGAYGTLIGMSSMILLIAMTYLSYLCMVRRFVPLKWLVVGGSIFAPVALVEGVLRMKGGFTPEAVRAAARLVSPDKAGVILARLFGSRVNQLEAFSVMLDYIKQGIVKIDPLSPLYLFAQTVPRSVWPDKPEMFADQMTGYVSPQVHHVHVVFNFIGPAETIYAFGTIAGTLIASAVYGYLFSIIDRYYAFCWNRPGAYLFLTLTVVMYLGAASQSGLFNSIALLQLILFTVAMSMFFRLRIHRTAAAGRANYGLLRLDERAVGSRPSALDVQG